MKPDGINVAIAEFCGWRRDSNAAEPWVWIMPNGKAWETSSAIPNYHGDLNACRDAVLKLPYRLQPYYMNNLFHALIAIKGEVGVSDFDKHTASTEVICKALLNTIGKWRDA